MTIAVDPHKAQAVSPLEAQKVDPRVDEIIKLAIMAVGGQGGAVLTDWVVDVAERNGYAAQSTSVAGVAQRTGATIYYVEMAPDAGRKPVFSLMPAQGDVDIMIAAEMMEAGRAIMRGFVTPDRTTLISSSHRAFATSEKIAPGDAIADSDAVRAGAQTASRRFIAFDMEKIAVSAGTVISAGLFGALAGSGTLPFTRESFEETVRASGRGVEASLTAFRQCRDRAEGREPALSPDPVASAEDVGGDGNSESTLRAWAGLIGRIDTMPEPVREMARLGLKKVVDFQDFDYGGDYLDRLNRVLAVDRQSDGDRKAYDLTVTAAKHVANAMVYDDVIRVADIKTRRSRIDRVEDEMGIGSDDVVKITEFMHPRGEEICSMMPVRVGRWIKAKPAAFRLLDRMVNRGRRVRTDSIFWFSVLYGLAGLRHWRRALLRHEDETAHLEAWLTAALGYAPANYELAVETLSCRRLIKGYSDTHARGLSKFDRVMQGIGTVSSRDDAADWARRLREAALADVEGKTLDGALETIRSFVSERQPT